MRNLLRGLISGEDTSSKSVPPPVVEAQPPPVVEPQVAPPPPPAAPDPVQPVQEPGFVESLFAPLESIMSMIAPPTEVTKPKLESYIDVALSFQEGGLLLIGWILDQGAPVERIDLLVDGEVVAVEGFKRYSRPDVTAHFSADEGIYGFGLILPEREISADAALALRITLDDGSSHVGDTFNSTFSSPGVLDLVRMHWYGVGAQLAEQLLNLPGGIPTEVLPALTISYEQSKCFVRWGFDKILENDDGTVLLVGWLFDRDREVQKVRLIDEESGAAADVWSHAVRTNRPDIVEAFKDQGRSEGLHGLITTGRIPLEVTDDLRPVSARLSLALYIFTAGGEIIRAPIEPTKPQKQGHHAYVELMGILSEREPRQSEIIDIIGPTIEALILRDIESAELPGTRTIAFGPAVSKPDYSVIVPLKGGVDFFRCQLALFAGDADFQRTELTYVIDDAAVFLQVEEAARLVAPHFGVPFQLLSIDEPVGYAQAINIAAAQASARRLVLLDADVMPRGHGWLKKLGLAYRSLEAPGFVAPRLVYEDGTIRHAATRLVESVGHPGWLIDECALRGIPSWMDGGSEPVAVDVVTLSCAIVDRELFLLSGGLPQTYLYAGFADAALCRILASKGRQNYYLPEVELDHPEQRPRTRFSHPSNYWKGRFNLYNCWAFNQLCQRLSAEAEARAAAAAVAAESEAEALAVAAASIAIVDDLIVADILDDSSSVDSTTREPTSKGIGLIKTIASSEPFSEPADSDDAPAAVVPDQAASETGELIGSGLIDLSEVEVIAVAEKEIELVPEPAALLEAGESVVASASADATVLDRDVSESAETETITALSPDAADDGGIAAVGAETEYALEAGAENNSDADRTAPAPADAYRRAGRRRSHGEWKKN